MIKIPQLIGLIMLLLWLIPASAKATNTGVANLLQQITQAQKTLSKTEQQIGQQRQQLVSKLNQMEQQVVKLRQQTVVARRLADEQTISLSQLEKRLASWQQQHAHQQNLLHRFIQNTGEHAFEPAPLDTAQSLTQVIDLSKKLEQQFSPQWQNAELVMPDGEIKQQPTLQVGPLIWYFDDVQQQFGLAQRQPQGQLQSTMAFADNQGLAGLKNQGEGQLMFDPSRKLEQALQQPTESLLQHLNKGGLWAIPILLFAIFAVTVAVIKAIQLLRLPQLLQFHGATAQTATYLGMQKVLWQIAATATSAQQRDDQLFNQLQQDKHRLERGIGAIAITASVSPLLGLLGTVSGMIETFKMMTLFGTGDPEVVSGGIAKALITTELGLVVAIPALILHAILNRRAKNYYHELESFAVALSQSGTAIKPNNTAKPEHNSHD